MSPLLLNIYLHHYLDLPLRDQIDGRVTYNRYLDDLCFLVPDQDTAEGVRDLCDELLGSCGMALHPSKTEIQNLSEAKDLVYLGFELRCKRDQITYHLPPGWKERRNEAVAEVLGWWTEPNMTASGREYCAGFFWKKVDGWLMSLGPAVGTIGDLPKFINEIAAWINSLGIQWSTPPRPHIKGKLLEARQVWDNVQDKPMIDLTFKTGEFRRMEGAEICG